MEKLINEARRLGYVYPDRADVINGRKNEIKERWETLKRNAPERKEGLERYYNLHRFCADYRELCEWIKGMKALISASELAKNATGASELLEIHLDDKGERHYFKIIP